MAVSPTASALVRRVLSGAASRELRLLAAKGLLPVPPDELIPLQIYLASDPDPEIAGRAATVMRATEPHLLADFAAHDANEAEQIFLARGVEHPALLEALLRRRDVSRALLVELASKVDAAAQEILILRQDAIVETPAILDALESNPALEGHIGRRIGEYREHLLPRQRVHRTVVEERLAELPVASEEEVKAAIIEAAKAPPAGERDESTGLTEGQIRMLAVPVRLKLARGASRTLRVILLRDSNPNVALATLTNNALSDDELEQVARSRSIVVEVLEEMVRHREWLNKYNVVNALVANPRTPVGISIRLVSRLGMRDLRSLSHNRNVPDAVRAMARTQYQARTR